MNTQSLLALMYLSSPALPIGSFAYSQGLESAIDQEWIKNKADLEIWIQGVLEQSYQYLDIPVFFRCYDAWKNEDHEAIQHWNQFLLASRESQELIQEDVQLGLTLSKLLSTIDKVLPITSSSTKTNFSFLTVLSYGSLALNIPKKEAAIGYLWSWMENQMTVACKCLPLGQSDAQQLLIGNMHILEQVALKAESLDDDELGNNLPGFTIASCLHETQYSRMFRS